MDFTNVKPDAVTLAVTEPQPNEAAAAAALREFEEKLKLATMDNIITAYVKTREKKRELDNEYESKLGPIVDRMAIMEKIMGLRLEAEGTTSSRGTAGTAYSQVKRYCQCGDWSAFNEWVVKNNRADLFQRRLNNPSLIEIIEATRELPPGIQVVSSIEVGVRVNAKK